MREAFSKENSMRIKKFEKALESLKDGSETYFSITKLTSIKGLCNSHEVLCKYCVFLLKQVIKSQVNFQRPSLKRISEWLSIN